MDNVIILPIFFNIQAYRYRIILAIIIISYILEQVIFTALPIKSSLKIRINKLSMEKCQLSCNILIINKNTFDYSKYLTNLLGTDIIKKRTLCSLLYTRYGINKKNIFFVHINSKFKKVQ